jgi:hypothetical protein
MTLSIPPPCQSADGQTLRKFSLHELDEFFAHVTAQTPCCWGIFRTHQRPQLKGMFSGTGDLQNTNALIPQRGIFQDPYLEDSFDDSQLCEDASGQEIVLCIDAVSSEDKTLDDGDHGEGQPGS